MQASLNRRRPAMVSPLIISRRELVSAAPGITSMMLPITSISTLSASPQRPARIARMLMAKAAIKLESTRLKFTASTNQTTPFTTAPITSATRPSRQVPPKNIVNPDAAMA